MVNQKINYSDHYSKWNQPNDGYKHFPVYEEILGTYIKNFTRDCNVLDIGCGYGFLMEYFLYNGFQNVYGVDIDPGQVAVCVKKELKVDESHNLIEYLSEKKFDIITATDVIEHLTEEERHLYLKAIYNSLNTDGIFICTVPNANSLISSRFRYIDYTHKISFTEHSLEYLIKLGGFKTIFISESYEDMSFTNTLKVWRPKIALRGIMFSLYRIFIRMVYIAEFDWEIGSKIPLTLNIKCVAKK